MRITNQHAANVAAMYGRAARIAILLSQAPHYRKQRRHAERSAYNNARAAARAGLIAIGGGR